MSRYVAPSAWPTLTLGELTERTRPICYGVLKPGKPDDNGVPLIRVTDISTNRFDDSNLMQITPALDDEFRRSRLNGGELLLSIQGTIGRVAICPHEYAGANISRTIAVVEPDDRVDRPFSYWFLRFLGETNAFHTVGTTRSSLNIETLRMVPVPVPPIPEQRRIAEILDKADALRAKRRATLAQLDILTQSIFIDMFGDPATNPKRWPVAALHALGRVTTGSTPPSAKEEMFNGPIPFVTPGDLESGQPVKRTVTEEGAQESRTVSTGATLVCCIGATIGKMGKATTRSAFNQQINAVEWGEEVNPDYGLAVMRFFKQTIITWGSSTTLPILKKSAFERIQIPVPPKDLQRNFADSVRLVEGQRRTMRTSGKELSDLFVSLQHRAFHGEL